MTCRIMQYPVYISGRVYVGISPLKCLNWLNNSAVFTTFRRSGAIQMSIVTVGVHYNGVAFTISPGSAKLSNLRRNPRCSLMISRNDWRDYAVLEGHAQVLSPDARPIEELR